MEKKASRVSSSSQGRGEKVPDKNWQAGRQQSLGQWCLFREPQDKEFEGHDLKPRGAAAKAHREGLMCHHREALGPGWLAQRPGELCQRASDMSYPSPPNSHERLFPGLFLVVGASWGFFFLLLFFNIVIVLFNWTSVSYNKLFLRRGFYRGIPITGLLP